MIIKFNEGEITTLKKGFHSSLTGSCLIGLLHPAETRGSLMMLSTTAKIRLQLYLENTYINTAIRGACKTFPRYGKMLNWGTKLIHQPLLSLICRRTINQSETLVL